MDSSNNSSLVALATRQESLLEKLKNAESRLDALENRFSNKGNSSKYSKCNSTSKALVTDPSELSVNGRKVMEASKAFET